MTNIGIKSNQLSNIRAALLDNAQNNKLEPKQTENFSKQIKDALDSVANAQNTSKNQAFYALASRAHRPLFLESVRFFWGCFRLLLGPSVPSMLLGKA